MENINIITKSKEQVRTAATQPWVIQSELPQHTPPKVIGLGGCVAQPRCWAQLIIGWLMWSHWPASQRAQSFKQEALLASWSCCHIWTMESSQDVELCRQHSPYRSISYETQKPFYPPTLQKKALRMSHYISAFNIFRTVKVPFSMAFFLYNTTAKLAWTCPEKLTALTLALFCFRSKL